MLAWHRSFNYHRHTASRRQRDRALTVTHSGRKYPGAYERAVQHAAGDLNR